MALPDGVTLRYAGPADAEALTTLHHACWDDAYADLVPAAQLTRWKGDHGEQVARRRTRLATHPRATVVAEAGGELIGLAHAGPPRDDDPVADLELYALYVRAAWWSTGVGHALLVEAVGDGDASLWVLEGNDRALRFYRRHGFAPDGATKVDDVRQLRLVRGFAAPRFAGPG